MRTLTALTVALALSPLAANVCHGQRPTIVGVEAYILRPAGNEVLAESLFGAKNRIDWQMD